MNAISRKRRSGLFLKIVMVIFIILYFNVILPSQRSGSSMSPLLKCRAQQVTDIHLPATVRLSALRPTGDETAFFSEIASFLLSLDATLLIPETRFINLFVIHPVCVFATINAP